MPQEFQFSVVAVDRSHNRVKLSDGGPSFVFCLRKGEPFCVTWSQTITKKKFSAMKRQAAAILKSTR